MENVRKSIHSYQVSRISAESYGHQHEDNGSSPPSPMPQQTPAYEHDTPLQQPTTPLIPQDQGHCDQHATQKKLVKPPSSAKLHRSVYVLCLVFLYMALALFAWIVTCILTIRPITAKHYGVWIWTEDNNNYGWGPAESLRPLYLQNESWFQAARVMQSIVSVLTIPLTTAVCSSAAVIFTQHNRRAPGLSVRQVMSLADRSWTDPATYTRTILTSKGWKRYGSSFLLLAMLLHILGSVISPLQEVFLSSKTIKTPTWPQYPSTLLDIPDQWSQKNPRDDKLVVLITRNALMTATATQPQALLWQSASLSCDPSGIYPSTANKSSVTSQVCDKAATFGNFSKLIDPFLAELSSGYSTGLIRQFIPRINSTAKYETVAVGDFPKDCSRRPGAFFVNYNNVTMVDSVKRTWGLQACMPNDLRQSPWQSTRNRQDFSEELYLHISWNTEIAGWNQDTPAGGSFYKVTVNTTAGYFELPNYMNGQIAGPLLAWDPANVCGNDCEPEGFVHGYFDIFPHDEPDDKTGRKLTAEDPVSPIALESVSNKGPLLTVAMALFGEGSFLANHVAWPQVYNAYNGNSLSEDSSAPNNSGACFDLAPMGSLLPGSASTPTGGRSFNAMNCISKTTSGLNNSNTEIEMVGFVKMFQYGEELLSNAFTAAAFIANQAWMFNAVEPGSHTLSIKYDHGSDSQVPVISRAGLIIISTLLGLDLLSLLVMALYATFYPRWTNQLDAFTMMRLGAAMADKVPLLIGRRTDKIEALDEIPGWIGDTAQEDEEIGHLALGAPVMVNKKRRYECYSGDHEPPTAKEMKASEEKQGKSKRKRVRGAGVKALDSIGIRM